MTVLPQASNSIRTPGPASSTLRSLGAHEGSVRFRGIKKLQNICPIELRELAQRSYRGTHLRALQRAQESHRDACSLSRLEQGRALLCATGGAWGQSSRRRIVARWFDQAISFQELNDGRRVQAANPTKIARALQKTHIFSRVEAVPAFGAAVAG